MSDLSPKGRALVDAARKGWGPSERSSQAVQSGIPAFLDNQPSFGDDAPGPTGGPPQSGHLSSAKTFARSPWGAVSGLCALGLCAVFVATTMVDVPKPSVVPAASSAGVAKGEAEAVTPPAVAETGTVSLDALPDAPPELPRTVPAAPRASGVSRATAINTARPAREDTLAEEVALVRAAQRSLRDGAPGEALTLLSTHATRFPTGVLREDRMALQVLSLCAQGDMDKARAIRAELQRTAPASTHLQRLSCAAP